MADQLYLSLWFPNFRLASLPSALISVLRQFVRVAGDGKPGKQLERVAVATVYPIDWTESPIYQRIYVNDERSAAGDESSIQNAVAEATEQLNDDTAYEFEMRWLLWLPEAQSEQASGDARLDTAWRLEPAKVRVVGFGPAFDNGSYDQNGHIRIDFGLDTPWTMDAGSDDEEEDAVPLDAEAAAHIRQNVEKLLAFTLSVEKHCGISSRLLWTESGEPLAEKLVASLQRLT